MKIRDFIQEVFDWTDNDPSHYENTCDTLKAGDPEAELGSRVAVTMFATPDVIRDAAAWEEAIFQGHPHTR